MSDSTPTTPTELQPTADEAPLRTIEDVEAELAAVGRMLPKAIFDLHLTDATLSSNIFTNTRRRLNRERPGQAERVKVLKAHKRSLERELKTLRRQAVAEYEASHSEVA